ncbi:MAG: transketolase C-terminal domain-containing protein, partial [Methanomassiliicoccales archaeon]
ETRRNLLTSIFLDIDLMEKHNQELQVKYAKMQCDADSELYRTEGAEIILTGYGTCARIARSAVDKLRAEGIKAGLFRPRTLFPFPTKDLNGVAACGKVLVVELSNGQYRDDLLLHLDRSIKCDVRMVNRMGGNLMKVEEVIGAVKRMLKGGF